MQTLSNLYLRRERADNRYCHCDKHHRIHNPGQLILVASATVRRYACYRRINERTPYRIHDRVVQHLRKHSVQRLPLDAADLYLVQFDCLSKVIDYFFG